MDGPKLTEVSGKDIMPLIDKITDALSGVTWTDQEIGRIPSAMLLAGVVLLYQGGASVGMIETAADDALSLIRKRVN